MKNEIEQVILFNFLTLQATTKKEETEKRQRTRRVGKSGGGIERSIDVVPYKKPGENPRDITPLCPFGELSISFFGELSFGKG